MAEGTRGKTLRLELSEGSLEEVGLYLNPFF
jgi:hypothetical protein